MGQNCGVSESVLLLHGYDSKPSALGDLAERLGLRGELVAGLEDLPGESLAWWIGDLQRQSRGDLTEYLDEVSLDAQRRHGTSIGSDHLDNSQGSVSIVGFSQGGAAALSWALDPNRRTGITNVFAVAGFLSDLVEEQIREFALSDRGPLSRPAIHMIHLADDEIVDAMVSERASRQLVKAGFSVTDHYVDGAHVWSQALSELIAQLLSQPASLE